MQPNDFVYKNVFSLSMKIGLSDRDSGTIAAEATRIYRQGKLKKATDVFSWAEKQAKKKKKMA